MVFKEIVDGRTHGRTDGRTDDGRRTPDIEGSQKLTEHFVLRWAKNIILCVFVHVTLFVWVYNSTPKAWCKTIVTTSFYIRSYISFAPSPRHAHHFIGERIMNIKKSSTSVMCIQCEIENGVCSVYPSASSVEPVGWWMRVTYVPPGWDASNSQWPVCVRFIVMEPICRGNHQQWHDNSGQGCRIHFLIKAIWTKYLNLCIFIFYAN